MLDSYYFQLIRNKIKLFTPEFFRDSLYLDNSVRYHISDYCSFQSDNVCLTGSDRNGAGA